MPDSRTFTYRLDGNNVISYVSPEWLAFAAENGATQLVESWVLGKSVWRFLAGVETQHLYDVILKRVRTKRVTIGFSYRCDAPDRRRFLEMVIRPAEGGGVELASRIVREEMRSPVALLIPNPSHSDHFVKMCSLCKRVATPEWLEVEEALPLLGIFAGDSLPQITHGICAACDHVALAATG